MNYQSNKGMEKGTKILREDNHEVTDGMSDRDWKRNGILHKKEIKFGIVILFSY